VTQFISIKVTLLPKHSDCLFLFDTARRRAAARKMKQMKNSSKDTDDLDNEDDLDDVYSDFNGTLVHSQIFYTF